MMNNRIKEVNGIKILRRYSAGSIFSGLICLGIVAVLVVGLLSPWLTFAVGDTSESFGVIKFFQKNGMHQHNSSTASSVVNLAKSYSMSSTSESSLTGLSQHYSEQSFYS